MLLLRLLVVSTEPSDVWLHVVWYFLFLLHRDFNLLNRVLRLQHATSLHLPSACLLEATTRRILQRVGYVVIVFVHLGDKLLLALAPLPFLFLLLGETVEVALHLVLEILPLLLVVFDESRFVSCVPVRHYAWLKFSLVPRANVTFKVLFSVERCCKTSLVEA